MPKVTPVSLCIKFIRIYLEQLAQLQDRSKYEIIRLICTTIDRAAHKEKRKGILFLSANGDRFKIILFNRRRSHTRFTLDFTAPPEEQAQALYRAVRQLRLL